MEILVTGGAGFLGSRLIERLLDQDRIAFDRIRSVDMAPCPVEDPRVVSTLGSITDPAVIAAAVGPETGLVYHLAAVVSSAAEQDLDLGLSVNLDATRLLLDACRAAGRCPRFVFSSSLAVFGSGLPSPVPEDIALRPESSYGTQKAIGELLVQDYTRRGLIDGRALRLPTVAVRPGRPNAAASSFVSSILREPLKGEPAACPVPATTELWLAAPQTVVENLFRAGWIQTGGQRAPINLPGITVTVAEMLDLLAGVAGEAARGLVQFAPDPRIAAIVESWPARIDASRARALGFAQDEGIRNLLGAVMPEAAAAMSAG